MRARRVWPLALLLVVLLAGCREEVAPAREAASGFEPLPRVSAGAPRSFRLGFSVLPARLGDGAYRDALDLAANYGELLLLQRAPAWSDFLPRGAVSSTLEQQTLGERAALQDRGLGLVYAIDVFDPAQRGQLAELPADYAGRDLTDPDLRRAFVAQARFVALNYRPAYLVLGVEVNAAFEVNPDGYEAFVAAYDEAFTAVKEASPTTVVFPSFQYEQLLGLVPWEPPHPPRWELLEDFPRMDAFAITTYPSFVFPVARKVPADYYAQIAERTALRVAFASVGFASAPAREGLNSSTAAEQRRFLQRLLTDADELQSPLLVWFAGRDPAFAAAPPLDLLGSIGLRTADDEPKEAWPAWEEAVNRPYDPAGAASAAEPEAQGS